MKTKYILALALSLALVLTLTACGGRNTASDTQPDAKLSIVATTFPLYDWTRQVLGDRVSDVELTLLLDKGVDLHSYQPTVDDLVKVGGADLFLYVGGESDEWVEDALKTAENKDMATLDMLALLGDDAREEEIKEGMEPEDHHHDDEDHDEEEHEHEYDEHVWLSLKNARTFVAAIADELCELDPDHAETYNKNAAAYDEKLADLDRRYAAAVAAGTKDTLVFGDRFPFLYLAGDYGLDYYAAFVGCSAESEASFETVIFLANKVDELGLGCVMKLEGGDGKLAQTVVENTADKTAAVLELDSMQSTTSLDDDYLSVMENNLRALKDALK